MNLSDCKILICPLDGLPLQKQGSSMECANNHSFDIAKQGYVNLLPVQNKRSKQPGDNKVMVDARRRFLQSAAYQSIAQRVSEEVKSQELDALNGLDAGCGEGYYLSYIRRALLAEGSTLIQNLVGVDISKQAILAAAKQDRDVTWVVGSNRQLPVQDQSLDFVICMFGFPDFAEFNRVLQQQGRVILVDPCEEHLVELRALLYDEVHKTSAPKHDEAYRHGFSLVKEEVFQYQVTLTSTQQILDLAMMTPHYFRAKAEARAKLESVDSLEVTVSLSIRVLKKL